MPKLSPQEYRSKILTQRNWDRKKQIKENLKGEREDIDPEKFCRVVEIVQELIEEYEYTQHALSSRLGIPQTWFSRLLNYHHSIQLPSNCKERMEEILKFDKEPESKKRYGVGTKRNPYIRDSEYRDSGSMNNGRRKMWRMIDEWSMKTQRSQKKFWNRDLYPVLEAFILCKHPHLPSISLRLLRVAIVSNFSLSSSQVKEIYSLTDTAVKCFDANDRNKAIVIDPSMTIPKIGGWLFNNSGVFIQAWRDILFPDKEKETVDAMVKEYHKKACELHQHDGIYITALDTADELKDYEWAQEIWASIRSLWEEIPENILADVDSDSQLLFLKERGLFRDFK